MTVTISTEELYNIPPRLALASMGFVEISPGWWFNDTLSPYANYNICVLPGNVEPELSWEHSVEYWPTYSSGAGGHAGMELEAAVDRVITNARLRDRYRDYSYVKRD